MLIWYIGAVISGIACGWLFCLLYGKLVPKGSSARYWRGFSVNVNGLIREDEKHFWNYYRRMIFDTLGYAVRRFSGVIIAILPLIILMVTIWPWLQLKWNQGAPLTVYPKNSGYLVVASAFSPGDSTKPSLLKNNIPAADHRLVFIFNDGFKICLESGLFNYILCPPASLTGLILKTFGFDALEINSNHFKNDGTIIIRAGHDDFNPLWPYLNDLEFLFFLGSSISSLLLMIFRRGDTDLRKDETVYDISALDYLLTQIAAGHMPTMEKIGNWESKNKSHQLEHISIDRPIYITGLARAGTTILLDILSRSRGIATHRYKDFPFIMTPIFWNRFTSIFSGNQKPVERPHKDGINITRESAEAFEEPIWQYFFPNLHNPGFLHQLETGENNPAFERFYQEHIKKILFIRDGKRYMSKANYNISRIDYINTLFPDALFLIPIRHPLYQIESLVRQHRLFLRYNKHNIQVSEYLKAAGHFEFGPQRCPICLTPSGGANILAAWKNGDDYLGYAIQWSEIYRYSVELYRRNPDLANRMFFVRYEDFCHHPYEEFRKIMNFLELDDQSILTDGAPRINPSENHLKLSQGQLETCWHAVEDVAVLFGYTADMDKSQKYLRTSLLRL